MTWTTELQYFEVLKDYNQPILTRTLLKLEA